MKEYFKNLLLTFKINKLKKVATFIGKGQKFSLGSQIYLTDGSTKDDIVLHEEVNMYGNLVSANNGKIIMGKFSKIGGNSNILCVNKVSIGNYTAIAINVTIVDNNNHPVNPLYRLVMRSTPHESEMRKWKYSDSSPIIIGENVWIGENVRICKGVTIGDNSIIAASSVVTKNVPSNSVAAGNPAKIVKTDIDQIPYPTTCDEFNKYIREHNRK